MSDKDLKVTHIDDVASVPLNDVTTVKRLVTRFREGSENLMLGICWIEPGGEPFRWSYPAIEEVYYVLKGKFTIFWDGNQTEVKEGDAVFFPAGVEYGTFNENPEPAVLVYCTYPAKM